MPMKQFFLLLVMISALFPAYITFDNLPALPPPNSPVSIAILSPVDYVRKVVTAPSNATIQAAPSTPLLLYAINISTTVRLDGKLIWSGNFTEGRQVIADSLSPGFHSIQISARNGTLNIYVLSPTEEQAEAQKIQAVGDPWYYKYVYAVIAAISALIAGYPLGILIRERYEHRKLKREPYEEL